MANQIPSRTKRRMEKRQAVWMLTLVLIVSLISFGFGIMVGKRGVPPLMPQEEASVVKRLAVAPEPPNEKEEVQPPLAKKSGSPELTFYDTLPKTRKVPFGTGINLPPQDKKIVKTERKVPVEKAVVENSPADSRKTLAIQGTAISVQGRYVVQTGSFKKREEAGSFQGRLGEKGYDAFIREVNLEGKGTWYRVLVGPFENRSEAGKVAASLKDNDKISGFVKKL